MDLFDFLEKRTLCPHKFSVGKNGDGWTKEHDPAAPHFGRWVDSNPDCRRPAHLKGENA